MTQELKTHMLYVAEMMSSNSGLYYTLTPDHLYFHDKKKLHKSKVVIRWGTPQGEEFAVSDNGGQDWVYSFSPDGTISLKADRIFPVCENKPEVIEAVQYTGTDESKIEIWNFCKGENIYVDKKESYVIQTPKGDIVASVGDYIIKGVNGNFYTCKSDIFEKTFKKAERNNTWILPT